MSQFLFILDLMSTFRKLEKIVGKENMKTIYLMNEMIGSKKSKHKW